MKDIVYYILWLFLLSILDTHASNKHNDATVLQADKNGGDRVEEDQLKNPLAEIFTVLQASQLLSQEVKDVCQKNKEYLNQQFMLRDPHDHLTPLEWAIYNDRLDLVQFLLTVGASVTTIAYQARRSPLMFAITMPISEQNTNIITHIMNHPDTDFAAVDINSNNPLHYAICNHKNNIIELLICKGVPVNGMNIEKQTPFEIALHPDVRNQDAVTILTPYIHNK